MKVSRHILLMVMLLSFCSVHSQEKIKKADTVFCDCGKARVIKVSGNQKTGPTISPAGKGDVAERSVTRAVSKYAFEKEHHSAWYKLVMGTAGNLSFDIIPVKLDDDYDFMLFAAGKNDFCDSLEKNKLKPARANISRDKTELVGKTGLSFKGKKELVREGLNDAFSIPLPVKKGEIYYLVLDNVYEKGEGHTIEFFFEQKVNIQGIVKNDENENISTQVSITGLKGDTLAK